MRKILFRGKRVENDKWVYGSLVPTITNCYKKGYEIIDCNGIEYDELDYYIPTFCSDEVIPETVGQFTGLTDKNGTKIFEGDICEIKGYTYIDETPFVVEWNSEYSGWFWREISFLAPTDIITPGIAEKAKIIGNIHDDPELINNKR